MIRKAGYAILAVLTYGIIESLLLGYKYYIIFTMLAFFTVAFEITYFNIYGSKAINNISAIRESNTQNFKKNKKVKFTLHFVNRNPYPVSIHFFDEVVDILEISGKTYGTVTIPKNGECDISYIVMPKYIGKYDLGNIKITIADMFHLASIEKTISMPMPVHIYPSMGDIGAIRSEMASNFIYTFGNHYSQRIGNGYNIYDIRQYTFGDDPRFILWGRYDESNNIILVKEMEEEREITTIFLIDYSINMNHGSSDRIYDKTITDIINASYLMIKNRDNVGFFLYSSEINIYIPPDKSGKSIDSLERTVSSILPSGEFRISEAIRNLETKQKKNVLVFVVTSSTPYIFKSHYRCNMSVFLINNESYYDYKSDNEFGNILIKNIRLKEMERLSGMAMEMRSNGIRCMYVNKKNTLSRIMAEYSYRRSMNAGT
jgi:uncharacterized protein (DUF58 family)